MYDFYPDDWQGQEPDVEYPTSNLGPTSDELIGHDEAHSHLRPKPLCGCPPIGECPCSCHNAALLRDAHVEAIGNWDDRRTRAAYEVGREDLRGL